MLWTRGVAARETLSYLDRRGIDAEPALSGAGISRRQLSQDDIGLPVASQYRFLELAAAEANDQLLGLHVAAEMDLRSIGLLFYLTGSAPTVSEALENLARYSRTTNEALIVEISRQKAEAILAIRHLQEFDELHRQFFELLALWLVRTLHTETNRDFTPSRVTFTHGRNTDLREIHHLLRCPVDFAQGVDSWVLPQRVMDLPIVSGDSQLLQILTAHADDLLAERHSVTGLQSMVANQLASLLPRGESRAAIVAQQLGMSQRSLTRHLAEEGTTFAEILEQLRRRLASRYLTDDRMSVQQIAWFARLFGSRGVQSRLQKVDRNSAKANQKAWTGTAMNDPSLAWRQARTVTRNLTLRYDRMMLLLDPTPFARGLAGKKVEVVNYPDGRFAVRHEGVALPFRVFDKIQTVAPGAIVENKRLGEALAFTRELQASYPPNRRRGDPRRRRPPNNLEAPGMPTKGRASREVLAAAAE